MESRKALFRLVQKRRVNAEDENETLQLLLHLHGTHLTSSTQQETRISSWSLNGTSIGQRSERVQRRTGEDKNMLIVSHLIAVKQVSLSWRKLQDITMRIGQERSLSLRESH